MIEKARELLAKHGTLSVPYLQRALKCTREKAIRILGLVCPIESKMDHSLPLAEFIERYKHRIVPSRKLAYKKRKLENGK